jgi:hypothetical protein
MVCRKSASIYVKKKIRETRFTENMAIFCLRGNPRVRYHSVHFSCRSRQADYMLAKSVDLQDSYLALAVSVTYVAEF